MFKGWHTAVGQNIAVSGQPQSTSGRSRDVQSRITLWISVPRIVQPPEMLVAEHNEKAQARPEAGPLNP
jgi:hypothetical protein